jgi:hypothetical protein
VRHPPTWAVTPSTRVTLANGLYTDYTWDASTDFLTRVMNNRGRAYN